MASKYSYQQYKSSGTKPCDICNQIEYLVEHHIEGREGKDANRKSNLAYICPNCHHKIHKGLIIIEQWTTTTGGRKLFWHNIGEESITGYDSKPPLLT